MRDYINFSSLYIPIWVLAGILMGIWAPHGTILILCWVIVGIVLALISWQASAMQTRQSREIQEGLGKLVSVTESSPTNVITAVAAKILELESKVKSFSDVQRFLEKHRTTNWIPMDEAEKRGLADAIRALGKHSVVIQHTGQPDCYEFAIDLHQAFKRADWTVAPLIADGIRSPVRSIVVIGRDHELVTEMTSALLPVTRAAEGPTSELYEGQTDLLIQIGPRRMRSGDYR